MSIGLSTVDPLGEWDELETMVAERAEVNLAIQALWDETTAGAQAGNALAQEALERAQYYTGVFGLIWGWRDVIREGMPPGQVTAAGMRPVP